MKIALSQDQQILENLSKEKWNKKFNNNSLKVKVKHVNEGGNWATGGKELDKKPEELSLDLEMGNNKDDRKTLHEKWETVKGTDEAWDLAQYLGKIIEMGQDPNKQPEALIKYNEIFKEVDENKNEKINLKFFWEDPKTDISAPSATSPG